MDSDKVKTFLEEQITTLPITARFLGKALLRMTYHAEAQRARAIAAEGVVDILESQISDQLSEIGHLEYKLRAAQQQLEAHNIPDEDL
jgi:hypothetical protein